MVSPRAVGVPVALAAIALDDPANRRKARCSHLKGGALRTASAIVCDLDAPARWPARPPPGICPLDSQPPRCQSVLHAGIDRVGEPPRGSGRDDLPCLDPVRCRSPRQDRADRALSEPDLAKRRVPWRSPSRRRSRLPPNDNYMSDRRSPVAVFIVRNISSSSGISNDDQSARRDPPNAATPPCRGPRLTRRPYGCARGRA